MKIHIAKRMGLVFLFTGFFTVSHAQKVTMQIDATKTEVYQLIILTLESDTEVDSLGVFAPEGFKISQGPNQKVAVSYMNGKNSYRKTYTYVLRAQEVGTFAIQSPKFYFGSKSVVADPVKIIVGYGAPVAMESPLDKVKLHHDYLEKPENTVRFVASGTLGYVEELVDGNWVLMRQLTEKELQQIKNK